MVMAETPATLDLARYEAVLPMVPTVRARGRVVQIVGMTLEAEGVAARVGEICHIRDDEAGELRAAEVVGFRNGRLLLVPLEPLSGVLPGSQVTASGSSFRVPVGDEMLGRVLDGLARPIDGQGPILATDHTLTQASTPAPLSRQLIRQPFSTGIRSIDALLTLGVGQRIFAGSGVGKSTVLGMIARYATADVNVIALIGERGREVREFLEHSLGPAGLARSVVVVATSDQPALLRLKAAWVATAVAEWFREQGRSVLLMMDSLTRFAMAQREIGLTVGEPPAVRGYTPSVFAMLPALLERAGTSDVGAITGLYTVLDDLREPVSDTARGALDGHIVLSRALAQQSHYPAVDVLASVSRLAPALQSPEHARAAGRLRELLAAYEETRDLISIGAYQAGSNADVDYMIKARTEINAFLQQKPGEGADFAQSLTRLLTLAPPAGMPVTPSDNAIMAATHSEGGGQDV